MYSAFPEIHFTIDDMVVEGDKVAVRYTISGTHKGEFMGVPPTNRKLTLWGICIDRIAGGRFVESWVRYDTLGFKQQLGLVPTSDRSNLKRVCSPSSIDDRCMGWGEISDAEAVGDGAEAVRRVFESSRRRQSTQIP